MTERKRQRCQALLRERERIAKAGAEKEPDRIRIDRELCLMGMKMPQQDGRPVGAKEKYHKAIIGRK